MIKFTVFGDLHYDEVLDGDKRVRELVEHINAAKPDFVVSLGDLCKPMEENKEMVLHKFMETGIPMYHTIGNHETDACYLETALDFLSLQAPYYSFVYGDIKFIVLNSCYFSKDNQEGAYYRRTYREGNSIYPIIPKAEKEWLERELSDGKKYVVFSHHSLVNNHRDRGIYNREEIRTLFRGKDVLLCMNGHDHGDEFAVVDDIPYYTVNSATYVWCGSQIASSENLKEKYGYLRGMLLYKQALYVDVEIDDNEIRIQGMKGDYLSVTPEDVELYDYKWNGVSIKAQTSSKVIKINRGSRVFLDHTLKGSILDIGGGGEGIIGRLYKEQVIAIDNQQEKLDEAPEGFPKVLMDATKLWYEDNVFDNVTCFFSLMFMDTKEQKLAIEEAARVLKVGGELHIWDCDIETAYPEPFCIELEIQMPNEIVTTTYGVGKIDSQNREIIINMCIDSGLHFVSQDTGEKSFYLKFRK